MTIPGLVPPAGFNPMRWNCEKSGCFNKLCRPKIEVFAECFPRKIGFSDIDGHVEINGRFLFLEWKHPNELGKPIKLGQTWSFESLTADGQCVVFVVYGDAESMIVTHCLTFTRGKQTQNRICDLDELKTTFRAWASWAEANPWQQSDLVAELRAEIAALKAHLAELGRRPPEAPKCAYCGLLMNGAGFSVKGRYYHRGECFENRAASVRDASGSVG